MERLREAVGYGIMNGRQKQPVLWSRYSEKPGEKADDQ